MSEREKEQANRSAIWSKHFLSRSCGLERLKWMACYESGACACQSLQKGWTVFYYWYCWGLCGPRLTHTHPFPVNNFLMWEHVHQPPAARLACVANSALFILHFFFYWSSRNHWRSALFFPLYHTMTYLGHCRWVGHISKFKAQDFVHYLLNLYELIKKSCTH